MRHKYDTRGIVLSRIPLGEANVLVTILTPELGLVRARAQGIRKSGAKLAAALATLAESEVVLVQGKEGWRVAGAVLEREWAPAHTYEAKLRAARVLGLVQRLVVDETREERLYPILRGFLEALATESAELHETAETLVVLRLLAVLGLDTGALPGEHHHFDTTLLETAGALKRDHIARINHGIAASGL